MSKRGFDVARNGFRAPPDITLPDTHNEPAQTPQDATIADIPESVCADLRDPIRSVGASGKLTTQGGPVPPVPEVTITEDNDLEQSEDEIGLPGENRVVGLRAEGELPKCAAQ